MGKQLGLGGHLARSVREGPRKAVAFKEAITVCVYKVKLTVRKSVKFCGFILK